MFDVINGLPVHPLVVHAVVVLLPLAVVGTIAVVAVPRWRGYAPVVAVTATVAALLLPVAKESGEALQERVGEPGAHGALGAQLVWFGVALAVLLWVLVLVGRRRQGAPAADRPRGAPRAVGAVVAALAVVAAVASGVQVYRVGDSGARAAWAARIAQTTTAPGDQDHG